MNYAERARQAKGHRGAHAANKLVVERLIPDPTYPDVTDMATGLKFLSDVLPLNSSMWLAIGIMHDQIYGPWVLRSVEPTFYRTSKPIVIDLINAKIERLTTTTPDPFDRLLS